MKTMRALSQRGSLFVTVTGVMDIGLVFLAMLLITSTTAVAQLSLVSVTNIPCNAYAVATSGHYLYVAGNEWNPPPGSSGLRIFDLSDPANPVDVGYNDGLGYCRAVSISGGYVYAVQNGLTILDNSNPTNPVAVGHIVGPWADVTVDGHYVYLGAGTTPPNVSIYEVSNPASPVTLGQIQTSPYWPTPMAVRGSYAYVADNFAGLLVSDISNPTNPLTRTTTSDGHTLWNLVVSGDYAYTAVESNSLAIYNLANPTNPTSIFNSGPGTTCYSLASYGNYLLTTAGWFVTALDVSNPTNALIVAQGDFYPFANGTSLHTLAVSQGYAYVAGGGYLTVISLGTPQTPLLSISTTRTNTITLSWPTPSVAFAVQQSPGLSMPNWVTLTNQPVVVGSQNQVRVPASTRTAFYRLVSQ